jgi:hypothetical protein
MPAATLTQADGLGWYSRAPSVLIPGISQPHKMSGEPAFRATGKIPSGYFCQSPQSLIIRFLRAAAKDVGGMTTAAVPN